MAVVDLIVVAVAEPVEGHGPAFVYYDRGFSEQIFGADKQVSAGLVQKMHSVSN